MLGTRDHDAPAAQRMRGHVSAHGPPASSCALGADGRVQRQVVDGGEQRAAVVASSARHCTASAPWPAAGGSVSRSKYSVTWCARSRRCRPAAASRAASKRPSSQHLAHARVHGAADGAGLEVGPALAEPRPAACARRAHHRAGGQVGEAQPVARHERLARVGAQRHGGDHQPRRRGEGEVLVRVDHRVHLAGQQRALQPVHERVGRELVGGEVELLVARGQVVARAYVEPRPGSAQQLGHLPRLPQGELGAARADGGDGAHALITRWRARASRRPAGRWTRRASSCGG